MQNEPDIRRYTAVELERRRACGDSKTDLAAVRARSAAQLETDIAADPDFRDVPEDWHASAMAAMPVAKKLLSLRLDADVIAWFRHQGPGYQTRINAVLKAFVQRNTGSAKPNG